MFAVDNTSRASVTPPAPEPTGYQQDASTGSLAGFPGLMCYRIADEVIE
jgi:hypothetical protein